MASLTIRQNAYEAASAQPLTRFELYEPMVSTSFAVTNFGLAVITAACASALPMAVPIAFAAGAAAPGLLHGRQLYTKWMPELVKMSIGECKRKHITGEPRPEYGLAGWAKDSRHSYFFDRNLAEALVGLYAHEKFAFGAADFGCAGKGEYSQVFQEVGIAADGFDFSSASVNLHSGLQLARLVDNPGKQYDLVTSVDEAMSKTDLTVEEPLFVDKLANATRPGGLLVVSCAVPGQPGPNQHYHTSDEVITIFEANGFEHGDKEKEATRKLIRMSDNTHIWRTNLKVFRKRAPQIDRLD